MAKTMFERQIRELVGNSFTFYNKLHANDKTNFPPSAHAQIVR